MKSSIASTVFLLVGTSSTTSAFTIPSPAALQQTNKINNAFPTTTSTTTTRHNMMMPELSEMTSSLVQSTSNVLADGQVMDGSYSKLSYYTTLGLYIMSFPGLWSQVKRSTTAKLKRKTYISDGENADGGKDLRQQAGEIMAYMKANNYEVVEAGEVITFRGLVQKSTSQAFFLVFCTFLGMASLALVLQIQFQGMTLPLIGEPNWFYLCLLSPYAGLYYWKAGDRVDDIKVKLASNDEETENEVVIEGNDEELDRMWRALELREKGMVKVEGLLEGSA